ncbi:MAG: DUF1080 domain-containing protein [Chitinophagaceae bacterium]|nr:MAG: DUF1080 domain-containing protein [Chitinophagaceae bacterium]
MLKSILAGAALAGLVACSGPKATTTNQSANTNMAGSAADQDGFVPLFDGTSFKGWHKYGGGEVGKAWQVKDGSLVLDAAHKADWQAADGGDIVTDEEFGNFHLKYEWKIDTGGNSGVIFYIHEDPKYQYPWLTGPEMQVLDNERHSDAKIHKHRAGDLYDLIPCTKETVKPALEWNSAEIKSVNGRLDLYLNGVNVVSTNLWTPEWKALVAGSKFKGMADFGTYKSGRIGLQDHGNTVWFRNIKIKKL